MKHIFFPSTIKITHIILHSIFFQTTNLRRNCKYLFLVCSSILNIWWWYFRWLIQNMYFTLCATSELAMSRFSNFIILLPERVSRAIILSIIARQPMRLLYKTGNIIFNIIFFLSKTSLILNSMHTATATSQFVYQTKNTYLFSRCCWVIC